MSYSVKLAKTDRLSGAKPAALRREGEKRALALFHQAAKRVPAYRQFLHEHGIRPSGIRSMEDFAGLPYMDKDNYIRRFSLPELCWDGKIDQVVGFEMSTGSSGSPTYWPLSRAAEGANFWYFRLLFERIFAAHTRRTLVLNCFTMGAWPAGTITDNGMEYLNKELGWPVYKFSVGLDLQHAVRLVLQHGEAFEQIVIAGYWKTTRGIIDLGRKEGVEWGRYKLGFFHGGETYPESWRDNLVRDGATDYARDINFYANTELGLMAMETPLSIAVRRRLASTDPELGGLLSNQERRQPSLQQFNPELLWAESVTSSLEEAPELYLTGNNAMPLIRYNTHDHGGVVAYEDLARLAPEESHRQDLPWPGLYVFGREHTSVTFYGLKIFPEHFVTALEDRRLRPYVGRGYLAAVTLVEKRSKTDTILTMTLELAPAAKPSRKLEEAVRGILIENLCRVNASYEKLYQAYGADVAPALEFLPHGDPAFKGNKQTATKVVKK